MAITSLLNIQFKELLEKISKAANITLPQEVISIALNKGVLHIRFKHPKTREIDVEPLPLETPAYLFKDEETSEITALEILDIDSALTELSLKQEKQG